MQLPSFGQVIGTHEVCSDVADALAVGLPQFLTEVHAAGGPLYTPPGPLDYIIVAVRDSQRVDRTPLVEISCPGWDDPPHRDENGNYSASFPVTVICYVRDEDYEDTQQAGSVFQLALSTVLVRAGFQAIPRESQFYPLDDGASRTLSAAMCVVDITVDGVISESGTGPFGLPPFGVVNEVDVDVEEIA